MCDITKWESHEWQMLLNEVFNTYWFQISENIDSGIIKLINKNRLKIDSIPSK